MAVSLRADDPGDLFLPLELPKPRLHILSVLDSPDFPVKPQSRF